MRIKLDENLPNRLAELLTELGHDVSTVNEEGLSDGTDAEIWKAVQLEKRFQITQDLDFSDTRRFVPGSHHGVMLLRLHLASRENLVERVLDVYRTENVEGWAGCFVVASRRKLRVQRPSAQ